MDPRAKPGGDSLRIAARGSTQTVLYRRAFATTAPPLHLPPSDAPVVSVLIRHRRQREVGAVQVDAPDHRLPDQVRVERHRDMVMHRTLLQLVMSRIAGDAARRLGALITPI